MTLREYVPGLMAFAAKFEGFTNHRHGLRCEHGLELRIAQLDHEVLVERELDAVHASRVVLPASLHLGSTFDDEAQGLVLSRAPFGTNCRLAQVVLRGERAYTRTNLELDRLAGIRCADEPGRRRKERNGCECAKAA